MSEKDPTAARGGVPPAILVLSTCSDVGSAERLAAGLVESRLAACVNIIPGLRSVYRWDNAVQNDAEVLLLIKTNHSRYAALEAWLLEHHPYELPEVLAVPTDLGLADYLRWIDTEIS